MAWSKQFPFLEDCNLKILTIMIIYMANGTVATTFTLMIL